MVHLMAPDDANPAKVKAALAAALQTSNLLENHGYGLSHVTNADGLEYTPVLLDRVALDAMPCGMPNCTTKHPTQIFGLCHPGYPSSAEYMDGVLTLHCAGCGLPVARIAVHHPQPTTPAGNVVFVVSHDLGGPLGVFTSRLDAEYHATAGCTIEPLAVGQWPSS